MPDIIPQEIGKIVAVNGEAFAESESGLRPLQAGSPIFEGEELITGADANLEVRFVDDTLLSQGGDSRIALDDYAFDPSGEELSDYMVNITEGTFRMVTGKIAEQNPERFKIGTPLATIGIRGTTTVHEVRPGQGEKHGIEEIHSGRALIVQGFDGQIRQISQSQNIVDISHTGQLSSVRSFSVQELNNFREIAPANIREEQEIRQERREEREREEEIQQDEDAQEDNNEESQEEASNEEAQTDESASETVADGGEPASAGGDGANGETGAEQAAVSDDGEVEGVPGAGEVGADQEQIGAEAEFVPGTVGPDQDLLAQVEGTLPGDIVPGGGDIENVQGGVIDAAHGILAEDGLGALADEDEFNGKKVQGDPKEIGDQHKPQDQKKEEADLEDQGTVEGEGGVEGDGAGEAQPEEGLTVTTELEKVIVPGEVVKDVPPPADEGEDDEDLVEEDFGPSEGSPPQSDGSESVDGSGVVVSPDPVPPTTADTTGDSDSSSSSSSSGGGSGSSGSGSSPSSQIFFEGGGGPDNIQGNELANTIFGYGGNDRLEGLCGDDVIYGGDGNDSIYGGNGDDTIYGGAGNNFIDGGYEADREGTRNIILYSDITDSGISVEYSTADSQWHVTHGTGAEVDTIENFDGIGGTVNDDNMTGMGGAGEEHYFIGSLGNDTYVGGVYDDPHDHDTVAYIFMEDSVDININLDTGSGTVTGGSGATSFTDILTNINKVYGSDNADHITGSSSTGNSITVEAGKGNDHIEAGNGVADELRHYDAKGGVYVNLAAGTATGYDGLDHTGTAGNIGNDTFSGFECVRGAEFDDHLIGDEFANTLRGEEGNDILEGAGGVDSLRGGEGNDTLMGGAGDDSLRGNEGDDTLIGGAGDDHMHGGEGHDTFVVTEYGTDVVTGDSIVFFETGVDKVAFSSSDGYSASSGLAIVSGSYFGSAPGIGTDSLFVLDGDHRLWYDDNGSDSGGLHFIATGYSDGFSINDILVDGSVLTGTEHGMVDTGAPMGVNWNDATFINSTTDAGETLTGTNVKTVVRAGAGDDIINTGTDEDLVYAGNGADTITDTGGNNTLYGQDGNDSIMGGAGSDIIYGGTGSDSLNGGAGYNTLFLTAANDSGYTIDMSTSTYTAASIDGNEVDTFANFTQIQGSENSDTFTGNSDNNEFYGRGGNDTMYGGDGFDHMEGGSGDDTLYGGNDVDTIGFLNATSSSAGFYIDMTTNTAVSLDSASPETDRFYEFENVVGSFQDDTIVGDGGNNSLYGSVGNDSISGGAGDDTLGGGDGSDTLDGGSGNNTVKFDGSAGTNVNLETETAATNNFGITEIDSIKNFANVEGSYFSDTITGDSGVNVLKGMDGDDTIFGNDDSDTLNGGNGGDTLYGGEGSDSLYGETGADYLDGGAGDDWIVAEDGDTIFGGEGLDTLVTLGASGVTINRNSNVSSSITEFNGDLSQIEYILGTSHNDTFTGISTDSNGAATIDETFNGGGGQDTITLDTLDVGNTVSSIIKYEYKHANSEHDLIYNFDSGEDQLFFDLKSFDASAKTNFGTAAGIYDGENASGMGAGAAFVFDGNGDLWYDEDGSGSSGTVTHVAHIDGGSVDQGDIDFYSS